MPPETALTESRALRDSVMGRSEVLDKVKALALLPDGLHVTTQGVADYFGVHKDVIHKLTQRHRAELTENGLQTLRGSDLRRFEVDTLSTSDPSYPQGRAHLTLYARRTVLNVAMLLRDSDVARQVRTYLLDAEEAAHAQPAPAGYVSLEQLVTDTAAKAAERILEGPIGARFTNVETRLSNVESCLGDVGSVLRDLGPVISRMSSRLERMERRLDATHDVVGAMSERLAVLSEDMKVVKAMAHTHD